MKILDPAKASSFAEIEALIAKIAPEWKVKPNIIDIVPALKTVKGIVQTKTLVLGFYVDEKLAATSLADRGIEPIPAEIEGILTDVIKTRNRPHDGSVDCKDTRSQMFDTLAGGMAVGNANMNAYGTLGMILFAQSDGRAVGLTNEHVLVFDGDGHMGDEVQQPRFYLNSEVSIDPAACCPNGQLHYRGVDNPIVDAAAAVFAATAIAAALSDEIDPHRRGQDATVPDADERTLKETVLVDMNYPEMPLPGRPYKLKVKWQYTRQTDQRDMSYAVTEIKQNKHYINTQELLTDKLVYERGSKVTFFALLGAEKGKEDLCGNYFVTAAALSPSHKKAYKIILRPYAIENIDRIVAHMSDKNTYRKCVSFANQQPSTAFREPRTIDGMLFDPNGLTAAFVPPGSSHPASLRFPNNGITVRFAIPVQEVNLRGMFKSGDGVMVKAYYNNAEAGSVTSRKSPGDLHLAADFITHVVLSGGNNEALLEEICIVKSLGRYCIYKGDLLLAPDEELGMWNTYLFAQTRNNVERDANPLIAAQTIGGLPVTNNFSEGGRSTNITYGNVCLVDINANGKFEVINPTNSSVG